MNWKFQAAYPRVVCFLAFFVSVLSLPARGQTYIGNTPIQGNPNVAAGLPHSRNPRPEIIISRTQYAISWNPALRGPNWAAWRLQASDLGSVTRTDGFAVDPDLAGVLTPTSVRPVTPGEYLDSCFDKGHQTPSGDRTASEFDNKLTFFMSNMLPQSAFINRVLWERLEFASRASARQNNVLFIYAGGIYGPVPHYIGPKKNIAVPDSFFKIIVAIKPFQQWSTVDVNNQILVVNMPNVTSAGTSAILDRATLCHDSTGSMPEPKSGSPGDWMRYRTTLQDVEAKTGYDFLQSIAQAHARISRD